MQGLLQPETERQLQLKWPFLSPLPLPPFLRLSYAYFARHFQIFQLQSQIATFSFCTHTHRQIHMYVCACVYVLYICSCCCCQLLPLLPEFLKRFAYFINRKCSLRATHKNNCYCHCRFSLSLLQVPLFPFAHCRIRFVLQLRLQLQLKQQQQPWTVLVPYPWRPSLLVLFSNAKYS